MNTDRLFEVLSAMHFLPADFKEALKTELKCVTFPKGHYLVQAHTPAHHSYFMESGFAVAYQYRQDRRIVTDFWQPGEIILSPKSFFRQVPTDEIIQLTTDSQLLTLSHHSANKLLGEYHVANLLARDITAEYLSKSQERIVDFHTLKAWERYTKLLKVYPGIELNVSQEFIASYLHITPQSLSRLKSDHRTDK